MRAVARALLMTAGIAAHVTAQQPAGSPRFEVTSVKPHEGKPVYQFTYHPSGSFSAILPVEWLIGVAHDIQPFERIVGEPGWARSDYFQIEGRPAAPVSRDVTNAMLRTLLEDRFGLVWRKDPSGKAFVYALTMARDDRRLGSGIRRSEPACIRTDAAPPVADRRLRAGLAVPCGIASAGLSYAGGGVTIGQASLAIRMALGEQVVDRTGLTGMFDYFVTLPGQNPDQPDAGASIFTAVEEQFGMKLQREEVQADLFIVERIARPTSN